MDAAIAKELAALRAEIEALRAATPTAASEDAASPAEETSTDWIGAIKATIGTMQSVLDSAESGVIAHPVAGAALAFLAGLLIGRVTKPR